MPDTQTTVTPISKAALSRDMVARARALAPRLNARALQAERDRRIPDETIADLSAARIFELLVPEARGGLGLALPDLVAVCKLVAPHCVSTAWVTGFYIIHNWMWSLMSKEAQDEIFASGPSCLGPVMVAPSVRAVAAPGGYRINGTAKWATGSSHAAWTMVSGFIVAPDASAGPPQMRMFAMPWSDARLEDTWHTSGMAATASHDVHFDNVFVPAHRVFDAGPARSGEGPRLYDSHVYRTAFSPALCLAALASLVGGALGASQHAIDRAEAFLSTYSGKNAADNPAMQVRLGKAHLMADAASKLIDVLAEEVDADARRAAQTGEPIDIKRRAAQRAQAAYIASLCRDTVILLAHGSGASGHMADSPIQRNYRDISMGACHVVFDHDPTMELHGKMLLNRPPPIILA